MKVSLSYLFIVAIIFVFVQRADAQRSKRQIKGYVRDSITGIPVVNAIISNETTHKMVTPGADGFFSITATQGDMIFINAFNYNFDTVHATARTPDTVRIYLTRAAELLPGVTVSTTQGYTRYQIDSLRRREAFVKDVGAPKMKTISKADNMGAGFAINLDKLSKKRDKDRTKAYNSFDKEETMAYTDYRFSPQLVAQHTGLHGDSLVAFLRQYTPTNEWLRAHPSNDDVLYYINDKMKVFEKNPAKP